MTRRQHSESVESLIAAFVERLFSVVEHTIDARTRILTAEWIDIALAAPVVSEQVTVRPPKATPRTRAALEATAAEIPVRTAATDATDRSKAAARIPGKRLGTRVKTSGAARAEATASAPPSPEEERRDSEFAYLRALLKPTGPDDASGIGDTLSAGSAVIIVVDPPTEPFRVLETEIRNQAHGLAQLPTTCCTARIATWAGRVRSYEETNGNRVAADLLLDKLRVLARAMDAGRIEALNGSWRTTDWPSYIRTNDALAEVPQDGLETLAESLPVPSGEPDYRHIWLEPS